MTAIPEKAVPNSIELMRKGYLNRYQNTDYDYLVRSEAELGKYYNLKYCLGVNSGASAIYLLLKSCMSNKNEEVLSNAFTFNAVPAAIMHAECKPVLVECNKDFVIDTNHLKYILERKKPRPRILLLSYMRGRVPNMDIIVNIVKKYNLILIEDCAHAVSVKYKNRLVGTFGVACAISTQANKLLNAGEGGFLLTNNDEIQAKCIIMSGCYEKYYLKHRNLCPTDDLMQKYVTKLLNYSMRMTNLQGCILLPQIQEINQRRFLTNKNYEYFTNCLLNKFDEYNINIYLPVQLNDVLPCYDSVQFIVNNADQKKIIKALDILQNKYKIKMGLFGHPSNARNFQSWEFLNINKDILIKQLSKTKLYIDYACDMRIPLHWPQTDMQKTADIIAQIFKREIYALSKI